MNSKRVRWVTPGLNPRYILLAAALSLTGGCNMTFISSIPPLPEDVHAPVVAVTSFDNRSGFEGQWKLGDGMADLLVSEFIESRNFTVVERQHFENVVGELQRQQSALFRKEGRTPIGRMKNAQYLVRGVINDFSQTSGGGLSMAIRNLFLLGRGQCARVSLTLTIVDVETGQILNSVKSAGLVRTGEAFIKARYNGISFGGEIFLATPLGRATTRAIHGGVKQLARDMPRNPWRPMVTSVRNGAILVNGGKDRDFRVGEEYVVRGPAEAVTDPATGDLLTYLPGPRIGSVKISQVDDTIALATPIEGKAFERGQWLLKEERKRR